MITREQQKELRDLAKRAGCKVAFDSSNSSGIQLFSKCYTLAFPNTEDGYKDAKKRLEEIIGKPDDSKIIEITHVCRAVWHLNHDGQPAKAREHVASIGHCKSTKFVRLPDGEEICASCWTKKPESIQE